jgi:hypothetical protein
VRFLVLNPVKTEKPGIALAFFSVFFLKLNTGKSGHKYVFNPIDPPPKKSID